MHQEFNETVTISQYLKPIFTAIITKFFDCLMICSSTYTSIITKSIPPIERNYLVRLAKAIPKLYSPKAASTLSPIGRPFCVLIALGMEDPARTTLASNAASTPYVARFCRRYPPSA